MGRDHDGRQGRDGNGVVGHHLTGPVHVGKINIRKKAACRR